MLVLRHLLHHKKSIVFLFFHMYMLRGAVLFSSPTCPLWRKSTLQTDQLIKEEKLEVVVQG